MLELRPSCEHCNKALPPNAVDARICSYECTFCAECVETVLEQRLSELRRRVRPAADPAGRQLEGRQLSREGPRQY